jgi:uncharacterized protein with HEPN domain
VFAPTWNGIGGVPSSHDPATCLADILENIDRIRSYVGTMDRAAFEHDGRTRDAVERCLERICEAAFRLGDAAAQLMPTQPWSDIRGMGNRLRHAYDRLSLPVIWHANQDELPVLEADVRQALLVARQTRKG